MGGFYTHQLVLNGLNIYIYVFLMFSVFACLCQKKHLKIWLVFLSCVQEFSLFFPLNFQLPVSINGANPRSRPSISPNIHRPTPIRNHQAEFLLRIPLPGWITRTKLEESPKTEAAYSLPMFAGDMPQSARNIVIALQVFFCKGDPGISPSHRPSMQGSSPSPWIQHGPFLKVKHIW